MDPAKDERTVVVRRFNFTIDAEIAREHLLSANILAIVSKDDAGGVAPHLGSGGIRLLVLESDLEKAREVLSAMNIE